MNPDRQKNWAIYENASRKALKGIISEFGLDTVDGKQELNGKSGACWEIDAKAISSTTGRFFIVECRRRLKKGLDQEAIAALAYRSKDTGASGALVVTPKGLQRGARTVAKFENIHLIKVSAESTIDQFLWEFRDIVGGGVNERAGLSVGFRDGSYDEVVAPPGPPPCNE
ncbi:hypothetical protein GC207_10295 [bacterium]|nr:hypothetical protein [bacterium]